MKSGFLFAAILVAGITGAIPRAQAVELVTGNNYFPYTDERLPEGGLATVLVKAIMARMEVQANITYLPWEEGYAATLSGRFLATYPYIRTDRREAEFLYSDELFAVRPHIFFNFQRAPGLTQPSEMAGRSLCLPAGWEVDSYLKEVHASGRMSVVPATNVVGCFKLLYDGKVDAVSIDRRLGTAAARAISNSTWFKVRRLTIDSSPNYLIIPKSLPGAQDWINRFNAAKAELRAEGTIGILTTEYFAKYQ